MVRGTKREGEGESDQIADKRACQNDKVLYVNYCLHLDIGIGQCQ